MKRAESIGLIVTAALAGQVPAIAQGLVTLRAAGPANDGFKAMYYAERSGIFAKYGLTVEIRSTNNGPAAAAALISGDIDVAMVGIQVLILAHAHGIAMRMLAPNFLITSDKPTTRTLVLSDSPIRSGRDLDGKTLATQALQDINTIATLAWIDQHGGSAKTLHTIEVPSSAAAAFLERGQADAATLIEPFASQAVATGKLRVLADPFDALGKSIQIGAYVAMEPVVERRTDIMSRLARGLHDAVLYTNSHPAQTVDLVASYTGATPEIVAKMNRVVDPDYCEVRNIQPIIDALARYGVINAPFPAEEIISSAALKPAR